MYRNIGLRALTCGALWFLAPSAQGSVTLFETSLAGKDYWVVQIVGPNDGLTIEQALARELTAFVKSEYSTRNVAKIGDQYQFGLNKAVHAIIEKPSQVDAQASILEYINRETILGTIEFSFHNLNTLDQVPMFKRIAQWQNGTDLNEVMAHFLKESPPHGGVIEVKRLAVKKDPNHRFVGIALMYVSTEVSLSKDTAEMMENSSFFPIDQILAETKPGARVRIYRTFGMQEVVRLPTDPDFSDGRGLSLLSATYAGVTGQVRQHISQIRPDSPAPPIVRLRSHTGFFPEIAINNIAAGQCNKVGQYIRARIPTPILLPQ